MSVITAILLLLQPPFLPLIESSEWVWQWAWSHKCAGSSVCFQHPIILTLEMMVTNETRDGRLNFATENVQLSSCLSTMDLFFSTSHIQSLHPWWSHKRVGEVMSSSLRKWFLLIPTIICPTLSWVHWRDGHGNQTNPINSSYDLVFLAIEFRNLYLRMIDWIW